MMRIEWWNWSHEELKFRLDDFRRLSGEELFRELLWLIAKNSASSKKKIGPCFTLQQAQGT